MYEIKFALEEVLAKRGKTLYELAELMAKMGDRDAHSLKNMLYEMRRAKQVSYKRLAQILDALQEMFPAENLGLESILVVEVKHAEAHHPDS